MTHARTLSKVDCMSDTKKCGLISLNNIKFFFITYYTFPSSRASKTYFFYRPQALLTPPEKSVGDKIGKKIGKRSAVFLRNTGVKQRQRIQ